MINEHNVRTRNRNILLQIPKVKIDFAKNGFFFMVARLYNSLPKDIRESANDFENKVNSYFSRRFLAMFYTVIRTNCKNSQESEEKPWNLLLYRVKGVQGCHSSFLSIGFGYLGEFKRFLGPFFRRFCRLKRNSKNIEVLLGK